MIRRTFQHVPGIGPWRERDLWARGFTGWDAFPQDERTVAISQKVDARTREGIARAEAALDGGDLASLARLFPAREQWRLYREFAADAVFFDIETDGSETQRPTVVGLFSQAGVELFIDGRNLDALPEALARHRLWVTFNGTCFDVPMLRRHFGTLPEPALHLDLRFVFRRLGISGGLKRIEERMGIGRPPHLRGADGNDAVLLWRAFRARGDLGALRYLAEYNLYDAFQLRSLMDLAYNQAAERLFAQEPRVPVFERGEILYDVSRLLLALGLTESDEAVLERVRREGG